MHYYKRNLGDYAKKAGKLSMLQHGSYTLLIDACYDRERFPTLEEAIDWTWASTTAEIEAVQFVLRKFFTLVDGVYVQERIAEEIAEYHEKAETNKRIAIERETKRKGKGTERLPSVDEPPPNHKPLTINQEPIEILSPTALPPNGGLICPTEKIVDMYHQHMPMNPRCRILTDKRRAMIRQRWKQASKLNTKPFGYETQEDGLIAWGKFFRVCSESDFLTGKVPGRNGGPPFLADLDFLFSPSGFVKTLENKYHRDVL